MLIDNLCSWFLNSNVYIHSFTSDTHDVAGVGWVYFCLCCSSFPTHQFWTLGAECFPVGNRQHDFRTLSTNSQRIITQILKHDPKIPPIHFTPIFYNLVCKTNVLHRNVKPCTLCRTLHVFFSPTIVFRVQMCILKFLEYPAACLCSVVMLSSWKGPLVADR